MNVIGEVNELSGDAERVLRRLGAGETLTVRERVWFAPVPPGGMQNWEVACSGVVFHELLAAGALVDYFSMFGATAYRLTARGQALADEARERGRKA